jgi:hypothetical protein
MASTPRAEGIEAIMFRTIGDRPSAWEHLLPPEVLRLRTISRGWTRYWMIRRSSPRSRRSFIRCWGGRRRLWSVTCG